ncbi:MAG: hypothetical protein V4538_14960 [Bacteroidota bacterium]
MPTEQTAMQQLIERLDKTNQEYYKKWKEVKGKENKKIWNDAMSVQTIAVMTAKNFLKLEREQFEKAYNQGDSDRDNQQDGNGRQFKNCMDYYNKTFNQ